MERNDFANVMNKMAIVYNKEITSDLLDVYWDILKPYNYELFSHAATTVIRKNKFFPKPAEILEYLDEPKELTAVKQAGYLINALSGIGYRNPVGWDDEPATKQLLAAKFNITRLFKNSLESDLKWIEKDFIESYLNIADYAIADDHFEKIEAGKILKAISDNKPENLPK